MERADELLIGSDGPTGPEIAEEGEDGEDSRPARMEIDRPPRLVASHLTYDEEADIPSHDQQGIERTEQRLRLTVVEDEDGIGAESCGRQQDGHQGPHIEMTLADGVGEPEVVDTCHIDAPEVEGTNLHTQTNDRQDDGHYQIYG